MDAQELICKCGGNLSEGLYCRSCKMIWPQLEDWMIYPYRPVEREFSPTQQEFINAAEMEAASPRHANCDGAPDGGHTAECLAQD